MKLSISISAVCLVLMASVSQVLAGTEAKAKRKSEITSEQRARLHEVTLDTYVLLYTWLSRNPRGFEENFLAYLSAKDRKDFAPLLKEGSDAYATLSREGKLLVFKDAKGKAVKIDWPDLSKPNMRVNGLEWVYHRNRPLLEQMSLLQRRLDQSKKWAQLGTVFLPSVEAQWIGTQLPGALRTVGPVVAGIANREGSRAAGRVARDVTIATVVSSSLTWYLHDRNKVRDEIERCAAKVKASPNDQNVMIECRAYIENREKSRRKGPSLLPVLQQLEAQDKFIQLHRYSCPDNKDGKDRIYHAAFCEADPANKSQCIADKDGKTHTWQIYAKMGPDIKSVKQMFVVDNSSDPRDPAAYDKSVVRLTFDNDHAFQCIEERNDDRGKKVGEKPYKPVCLGERPDPKTEPPILTFGQDLMNFAIGKMGKCTVDKVEEKQAQGGDTPPAQPAPVK